MIENNTVAVLAPVLTQQLRDARVNVEHVVAEQRWLLCLSIMLSQDFVEQPLTLHQVVCTGSQTSTDLNHQLIWQKLQTVHRP